MYMSALFFSVFTTTVWLVYVFNFLSQQLGEKSLSSLEMPDFLLYTALVFVPVWVIWHIYSVVMRVSHEREKTEQQNRLLGQVKKNMDYTDLTVRLMLEAQKEIKDGFVIQKFDVFVADLNELLAEIAQNSNAASSLETEQLWKRVKNGERWVIGKSFLEAAQTAPDFAVYLAQKAAKDSIFKGTLQEFCNRYQNLCSLLEKHDKERVFLHILETGVMGKVYAILAPVAEAEGTVSRMEQPAQEIRFEASVNESAPAVEDEDENFFSKLREKMETPEEVSTDQAETYQPRLDVSLTGEDERVQVKNTHEENEIAYPFGGWMNEDDSQK